MMNKVYCGECKHCCTIGVSTEKCNAPENMKDTYYSRNGDRKWIPSIKNQNNNCPYFKESER